MYELRFFHLCSVMEKKEFSDHGDKTKMTIISHREGTLTNAIMVLYVAATALNKRKQKVTKL